MRNGELPYGHFGVSVSMGTPLESAQITVRHSDLCLWMQRHYPDQRPYFLFESINDSRGPIGVTREQVFEIADVPEISSRRPPKLIVKASC